MRTLWQHQRDAVQAASGVNNFAIFFEPGCGKTLTLITILQGKYDTTGQVLPTLILCPQIVIENWRRELEQALDWSPGHFVCLTGSGKQRAKQFTERVLDGGDRIVITNYESLLMKDLFEMLKRWANVLVLDESHKCKDLASKRTKLAYQISKNCSYRYILSGTPIVNDPMDIFSQYLILDQGATFGDKLLMFKKEYFYDANADRPRQSYFPDWRILPGALSRINQLVYKKAARAIKAECLDLPPLVRKRVDFELEGKQRRTYLELEKDACAEIDGKVVSADLAIKKAIRLQQVSSGFVKLDDGSIQYFEPNTRLKALEEVLSGLPKSAKVIIWSIFKEDYKAIRSLLVRLRQGFVEVTGETPNKDRQKAIDLFQSDTRIRIFIGHPAASGIGCNLTAASYSIFYTRNYSRDDNEQAEARNYRGGSEIHESVTAIDLVAMNTLDDIILSALQDKKDVSEAILNHIKVKK